MRLSLGPGLRYVTRPRRLLTVFLTLVLVGCTSAPPPNPTNAPSAQPPQPTTRPSPPTSAQLATAPKPLTLPTAPDKQVQAIASSFAAQTPDRPAAVLAAFSRAGIPVVDTDGRSLTTKPDDVFGIPWSLAWTTAVLPNPGARISLTQVAALLTANWEGQTPNPRVVASDLVKGLRAALKKDPAKFRSAFVAQLVRAEARRAREVDLANAQATADQIVVTPPTAALLVAAGLRAAVAASLKKHAAADSIVLARYPATADLTSAGLTAAGEPTPASAAGCTPDGLGQWALWLGSKVAAGAPIAGVGEWDGIFVSLLKHVVEDLGALEYAGTLAKVKSVSTVAGYLTAALSALALVVALLTYTAEAHLVNGEPLERTKSTRNDGKADHIEVKVFYDYGKGPPDLVEAMNCILTLLVAVGNNTTLPSPNPGGVEVTVTGARGFADRLITKGSYVLFGPETYKPKQTADDNGVVRVPVQGRMQKREVPEKAKPTERDFSVLVEANADPVDQNTIAKSFLDSLICAGGLLGGGTAGQKGSSCVDAVGNIVKQFNWDLGEFSFRLKDWAEVWAFEMTVEGNEGGRTAKAVWNGRMEVDSEGTVTGAGTGTLTGRGGYCVTPSGTVTFDAILSGNFEFRINGTKDEKQEFELQLPGSNAIVDIGGSFGPAACAAFRPLFVELYKQFVTNINSTIGPVRAPAKDGATRWRVDKFQISVQLTSGVS